MEHKSQTKANNDDTTEKKHQGLLGTPNFNLDNDEHTLPKATLTQMIKEFLPENVRMSQQSSELITQLSMHFLNYLSDTSNNVCNAEGKKTITPSHVCKALQELKMHGYLAKILEIDLEGGASDLESVSSGHKAGRGRGRGRGGKPEDLLQGLSDKQTKEMIAKSFGNLPGQRRKPKPSLPPNMTEEEARRLQEELFNNARQYNYNADEGQNAYGDENNGSQEGYTPYPQGYQVQASNVGGDVAMGDENVEPLQGQFHAPILPSVSEPLRPTIAYASHIPLQKTRSCKEVEEVNFDEEEGDQ